MHQKIRNVFLDLRDGDVDMWMASNEYKPLEDETYIDSRWPSVRWLRSASAASSFTAADLHIDEISLTVWLRPVTYDGYVAKLSGSHSSRFALPVMMQSLQRRRLRLDVIR